MSAISIPCPATLLPTKAELVNIFTELASVPSKIEAELAAAEQRLAFDPNISDSVRAELEQQILNFRQTADDIRKRIDQIKDSLGNFPISVTDPVYNGVSIPDLEWERRMTALTQEYHLYVQSKMMEIIDAVLPISFSIPVLGLSIDVVKIFSDAGYRAGLKAQIQQNVDSFHNLIPEPYKSYAGENGIDSDAIKAEITWSYIMGQLKKGGLKILYDAFGGLIDKFKTIWNALGLPALPALTDLNVRGLIEGRIASLKAQLKSAPDDIKNEIRQAILDAIDSISVAGFGIDQIIGGDIDTYVTSLEQKIERKLEALRDFGEDWPEYLIRQWMQKVTAFFNAIGLSALTQWITFNFCQFLKLIGVPTSIDIGYGVSVGLNESAALDAA
jgi:hypothetical protein